LLFDICFWEFSILVQIMSDDIFLKDLKLTRRSFDQEVSDREKVDLQSSIGGDLQTVSGQANLAQAIINRLLTRRGELTRLGHPNYGSRLHQLIGEVNNNRTRGLAEIYIRECLAQESRIEEIRFIKFKPPSRGMDREVLEVTLAVKPLGQSEAITFTIAFSLGG
jgi:phage baseplate assembly protein W